eukprot:14302571-Ditylum_brightwellii.AAC.1
MKIGDITQFEPAPSSGGAPAFIARLPPCKIPPDIQEMIDQNEMDGAVSGMAGKPGSYAGFWK